MREWARNELEYRVVEVVRCARVAGECWMWKKSNVVNLVFEV